MNITEDQLKAMQARVKGGGVPAEQVTAVRPILPAKFTLLGHAVSVNKSRVSFTGADGKTKTVKTSEAASWAKLMDEQLRAQWGKMAPVECEVFVIYDIYLSANTMDYANGEKAISDALQKAGVLKNDRLIRRGTITKHVDRNRPRVEVVIYESTLKPL